MKLIVKLIVLNLVQRWCSNVPENSGPRVPHHPVVKDTISKFAINHSTAAAVQLSALIAGPKKSTIRKQITIANTVRILEWVEEDNIHQHMITAKSILDSRVEKDTDQVNWIIGFDATATNTKFGVIDDHNGRSYVVGGDHMFNKPIEVSLKDGISVYCFKKHS